jgi:hypothetical protein
MEKAKSFEDLIVWQKAHQFVKDLLDKIEEVSKIP